MVFPPEPCGHRIGIHCVILTESFQNLDGVVVDWSRSHFGVVKCSWKYIGHMGTMDDITRFASIAARVRDIMRWRGEVGRVDCFAVPRPPTHMTDMSSPRVPTHREYPSAEPNSTLAPDSSLLDPVFEFVSSGLPLFYNVIAHRTFSQEPCRCHCKGLRKRLLRSRRQ